MSFGGSSGNRTTPPEASGGSTEIPFHLLVESLQDHSMLMLSPDGTIVSWNQGAERIFGYQSDEIIGRHVSVFYPPEDKEAGKPEQELTLASRDGRFESEDWRIRKNGEQFWANVVVTAVRSESGELLGFVRVTRDLTTRKQSEDQLRKMKDDLQARVSDLNEKTRELERSNRMLQDELTARRRAEEAIRALSTPVLPMRERLLILPIIGILDSARALQLTEQLLNAVRSYRAKAVVVDITGVPIVDSRVANHLLQTVEATRLMGAAVIVTGLSPEIAQTLVRLGVDLSKLHTVGDLQGGIEAAEALLGYRVIQTSEGISGNTE